MDEMFSVTYEKNGNVLTVKPNDRVDTVNAPKLEESLRIELEDTELDLVVMDLSQVRYVSSAGLRVFLVTEEEMEKRKGSIKLVHVNENVMEVLEMTGFLDMVEVEAETETEA